MTEREFEELYRNKKAEAPTVLGLRRFREQRKAAEVEDKYLSSAPLKVLEDLIADYTEVWEDWTGEAVKCKRNQRFEESFEIGIDYWCVKDYSFEGSGAVSYLLVLDMHNKEIRIPKIYFEKVS